MFHWLLSIDGEVLLWIQQTLRCALWDPILIFYTHLGDAGRIWILLSLVMLFFPKTRKIGFLSFLALLLGFLCTNVTLKHLVGRARPWLTVEGLIPLIYEGDPNSFPSGHTCSAFAAAGVWMRMLPRRWMRISALILATLMGFSRLYVGVHFPSDVLMGMLIGLGCSQLVYVALHRFSHRRHT